MKPFALRMAAREWRSTVRRLGVYMMSITVGVTALVALHSFKSDVVRSIRSESQTLLGADIRLSANREIPDSVTAIVDSLFAEGAEAARVTSLVSMALAERSGLTRLVQVRGVEGPYPFYGTVTTDPPGLWDSLESGPVALVDPAVMVQLSVGLGDTLKLGDVRFEIIGSVEGLPTDVGLQSAAGPRIFVDRDGLYATGLLTFGSLARYSIYLRVPAEIDPDAVEEAHEEVLRDTRVSLRTPDEQARSLTRSTDVLADYLGLVGIAALLLGGVGVGSAVNVYVRGKLTQVAVLRCVGATQRQVFSTYLLQAVWMGLLGSAVGAVLGVAFQRYLPLLIRGVFPVPVASVISWSAVLFGLALGTWVAFVFALLPLLEVRRVSPLQALRHGAEPQPKRDPAWALALAAIAGTVVVLTLYEAPSVEEGLYFAGGLGAIAVVLWLVAVGLAGATRRFFPKRASYTVRQGVANLFRPQNQTVAVTLALGFGVLVVGVILQLQRNLARELTIDRGPDAANVLLFDVQPDQEDGVQALLSAYSDGDAEPTPIVPSRIAAIAGEEVADILADTLAAERPARWALRREYRNTFRQDLKASERIIAGRWWEGEGEDGRPGTGLPRISMEQELAEDLGVGVGDEITWLVSGREIPTIIASLREVDWARFDTNFFVVFEPGTIEDAPRTSMVLARIADEGRRIEFQQRLVRGFPNVSVLDLSTIQATVESILAQILAAIRILAGLCTAAGLIVMAGSIASTRAQRRREGALLRTIGARFSQIRRIVFSEYVALGSLAAFAGGVLAILASWLLTRGVFDLSFVPSVGVAVTVWLVSVALTVATGVLSGRGSSRSTPLSVLREATD